ncbi:MAG: DNA gyrase subunit B [Gemmataceae bacterium]|nr:DNA gyrase subunit B [Gemmataceae bacterium]MCS7270680.1 DNA gyrase subunit B [Gemmataceae bacterium]MDW8242433.1 DNA gyrase subunit B [Thermogemmata sp.]
MTTTPAAKGAVVANGQYTEEHLKTLKDAAHIRQNPGMYIGNTQSAGLHHLVYEIVYNSVDEWLAGYCHNIRVVLHKDGAVSVIDDGRGIPVGIRPETGRSALEEALTIAGTSGKFDNEAYRVSVGLHGMGAKAMNALSEWCEAEVRRDGRVYKMEFERGYATTELQDLGPAPPGQTGTTITFKPDPEIFGDLSFDYDTLADRFREIAYLCQGLTIALIDERDGRSDTFHFQGGIAEFVAWLNQGETVEHPPIAMRRQVDYPLADGSGRKLPITVEVALQYTQGEDERIRCYTNNAFNPGGGTHLSGFRAGLTRAISTYGKKEGLFKPDLELRGEDFRTGLTAIVSISHPDPVFESQTKIKLNNPEVEGIVTSTVYDFLTDYLEKNPSEAARICKRVALAAEARIAARKARDAVIDRKKILGGGGLPGKLMDCTTRQRDQSELFLVEGDSAGGSAESGRDRYFQAVLPLRGKVLNVEKARLDKLLKNSEITALIAAIGIDIDNVEDISKVRYGKIIILTDADVDGQHIRTLLLTFFFRQMRKLIEEGYIYVARPPLYKVTQKKEVRFVATREEMLRELTERGLRGTQLRVTRPGQAARELNSEELGRLLPVLADIENVVVQLERRGQTLESVLRRARTLEREGRQIVEIPVYHVRFAGRDYWFATQQELQAFRAEQAQALGQELTLSDAATPAGAPPVELAAGQYALEEWHELRSLNRALLKLLDAGFEPADLLPLPRLAGREPPVRFTLIHGDKRTPLPDLLTLPAKIRDLGEAGIAVTRFKGLGEMNPEELWATTLDPKHRSLRRVTLSDAQRAEELFRMLMGEEVEGRKQFIMKRAIHNFEDIDYGA